jgi:hypothetical protein
MEHETPRTVQKTTQRSHTSFVRKHNEPKKVENPQQGNDGRNKNCQGTKKFAKNIDTKKFAKNTNAHPQQKIPTNV